MFSINAALTLLISHLFMKSILFTLVSLDKKFKFASFKKGSFLRTLVNDATTYMPLILGSLVDVGSTLLTFVFWIVITLMTLPEKALN